MDEIELFDLLKTFGTAQFVSLRRQLHLGAEHLPPRATPAETADEFIKFIQQRDNNDLSALVKAALTVVGRLPKIPATLPTGRVDRRPRLLVLAANSSRTTRLKLQEEADAIREALGAEEADRPYELVVAEAVEVAALTRLLLENKPRVLHFSGHGNPDGGLNLLDGVGLAQAVAPGALATWFAALLEADHPECVVLNACYTNETAKALVTAVKCVVGMSRDFDDDAAIAFATGFYRGLVTYEDDYRRAFQLGCAEIDLLGRPDSDVPVFSTRLAEMVPRVRGGELDSDLVPLGSGQRGPAVPATSTPGFALTPTTGTRIATVWFGTNRKPVVTRRGTPAFGNHRDSTLHVGTCEVLIPKAHRYGEIGSGLWTRLWHGDDRLSVEKITVLGDEAFWAGIAQSLAAAPEQSRTAVVFIHGYCTTFEGAAVRAAQIGCDLGVPGVMAFYSWPSRGNFGGYVSDIEAVEAAVPHLVAFLRGLAGVPGVERIHLIAHSMGNRGLLAALRDLFGGAAAPPPPRCSTRSSWPRPTSTPRSSGSAATSMPGRGSGRPCTPRAATWRCGPRG